MKSKSTPAPAVDRWKPIRIGHLYCSPACGGDCTYVAYLAARRAASRLAKTMGEGWTADVWENLGWHWKVVSPCTRFRIDREHTVYSAGLCNVGDEGMRYVCNGLTARGALANVILVATNDLKKIGAVLKNIPTY